MHGHSHATDESFYGDEMNAGMKMEASKGENVEVSSDEDGFRGAWFCAKVVKKQGAGFVVEYRDLMSDKDESKPLREKVDCRHIRPCPPQKKNMEEEEEQFALYEEVDAFDNDGWWVGVVTKVLDNHNYIVYFMQTKEQMVFHHSQLRPHLDFIDNKWVQASKALIGANSLDENVDLETHNGNVIPYILCQNTETNKLPHPLLSVDRSLEDTISKLVRRSLRCTEKKTNSNSCKVSLEIGDLKREQGTQGHFNDMSPTNIKKVREEIVDLETLDLSPQQNRNQESHQFFASLHHDKEVNGKQESHQFSASIAPLDKGVNATLLHTHLEAINHDTSFLGAKTGSLVGLRKTQRKRGSQLNDASTCKRKKENTYDTIADGVETLGEFIAVKGKQKNCLKQSSSVHVSEAIDTTILETHNLNTENFDTHIISHSNISACSMKSKKQSQKNKLNETYTQKEEGVNGMENKHSCIPPVSPVRGEKIFTITIPHLEYVGQTKADEGNSGSLHGRASLRELKLSAYHSVLQALYLQGAHNWKHEILLTNLRESLNISNEEHSTELRRITTANYD